VTGRLSADSIDKVWGLKANASSNTKPNFGTNSDASFEVPPLRGLIEKIQENSFSLSRWPLAHRVNRTACSSSPASGRQQVQNVGKP
jgi:hypothetical protein